MAVETLDQQRSAPTAPGQARTTTTRLPRRERAVRMLSPRAHGLRLLLLATVLGVWEVVGRRADDLTFAPPSAVFPAAADMIESGELQAAVTDSLVALLLGFAAAALVGVGAGFTMGWWRTVGRTLDPFVAAMYVVPIAALIPAIVVWFGLGLEARAFVIFLFALFEILLNAYAGVRNVDRTTIDVARTFGARRSDLFFKAALPASMPFVFVGLRIGASRAIKGMVLAEMLFAVTGLGGLIIDASNSFRMDKVFVTVITISLLGILLTAVVQTAERYVMRWRDA